VVTLETPEGEVWATLTTSLSRLLQQFEKKVYFVIITSYEKESTQRADNPSTSAR
jgi:hypothetical protein